MLDGVEAGWITGPFLTSRKLHVDCILFFLMVIWGFFVCLVGWFGFFCVCFFFFFAKLGLCCSPQAL